jgi:polygalacturonase
VCACVQVHDVTIWNEHFAETDGIDPDSQINTLIERVHYRGGDDGVAIKSGWDQAGINFARPCINVTVRDSVFATPANCVAIGSEMSGGVRDVFVYNITCIGVENAFFVKSAPGRGGFVQNIVFRDAILEGVYGHAIRISLDYGDHPDGKPVNHSALPVPLDNFQFLNIVGRAVDSAGYFEGLTPAPITNVLLSNVMLDAPSGYECSNVSGTSNGAMQPAPCPQLM